MELLSVRGRGRALAAGLALACAAGCMILGERHAALGPAFNHALHVGEQGLECLNCHQDAQRADAPGMPAPEQCEVCHAELDADKAPDKQVSALFDGEQFRAAHVARLGAEPIFSHARHVGAGVACDACHAEVVRGARVVADMRVEMAACTSCHAQRAVANECATCHREVGRAWAPTNHAHEWLRLHGRKVRDGCTRSDENCALCHAPTTCVACHKEVPPANHDVHWRLRGHGVAAEMDRQSCGVCHERDSCERCHAETEPMSHVGSFGAPLDTHCLGCHFPLASQGCAACHRDTHSHREATPKPNDPVHVRGMNCRQCHGVAAPLPHVDNGDDCNACHS